MTQLRFNPRRRGTNYGTDTATAVCEVPCPSCSAPAQAPCTTAAGTPSRTPHATRGRAWASFQRSLGIRPKDVLQGLPPP